MNNIEHVKGKLIPTGKTIEDYIDINDYYRSLIEDITDYFDTHCPNVVAVDGYVYTIEKEHLYINDDVFTATKEGDGSYQFELKYNNSRFYFKKALEEALNGN